MALLYNSTRNTSKLMYLEYANVYSVMNDVPDNVTTPKFEIWMNNYGTDNRDNMMFVISYKDVQYFTNAMSMRKTPINWTYIDAIGFDAYFGYLNIQNAYNLSDADLKALIRSQELSAEENYAMAHKHTTNNHLELIAYAGGPYLKVPQFGAQFAYDFFKMQSAQNLIDKNHEIELSAQLEALNRDPWMTELMLDWITRLRNIGVKTIVLYQLVEAWTDARFGVPLLRSLNGTTTPTYDGVKDFIVNSRTSTFPLSVAPPADNFVCSPACVWGDCINNTCVCYVGYSGSDCNTSSPVTQQQQLGINLDGISDWSSENPLVDVMKTSR